VQALVLLRTLRMCCGVSHIIPAPLCWGCMCSSPQSWRDTGGCGLVQVRGGSGYETTNLNPLLRSSLSGTGRVADLWDVHSFCTRNNGMVAIFRHHSLGTAVELSDGSFGLVTFVENDERNASVVMAHGRLRLGEERRMRGYTPLVRDGRTWWDVYEGFIAPDTLEALREEAGERPMVAEWLDVGEGSGWEAFDDGSMPYVKVTNTDGNSELFITETGFIFVGAPAGPEQPHKPQGVIVEMAQPAQQLTLAEAKAKIALLESRPRSVPSFPGAPSRSLTRNQLALLHTSPTPQLETHVAT
jgi:hypothetical protein